MGISKGMLTNPKQTGFTIIELVVVILLTTILAGFALSRWSGGVNPNAQAQQIADQIRFAQALAMTHNQVYLVNFITSSPNGYNLSTGSTATPASTVLPDIVTSSGANTPLSTGITYGTLTNLPNNLIAFDSFGIPYTNTAGSTTLAPGGADATIPIIGGGITRTIHISPTTGYVTVQ